MAETLLDPDLGKVLYNHEWRIKRLEELPIGCKFDDNTVVVVPCDYDVPPLEDRECGVCWVVAGSEDCEGGAQEGTEDCYVCEDDGGDPCLEPPCDTGDDNSCLGCIDTGGGSLWEGQIGSDGSDSGPMEKPLAYDPATDCYYQTIPNIAGNIWPDVFDGPQSIEVTFSNFANDPAATPADPSITDYAAVEVWRRNNFQYGDGLRAVIQAWPSGFGFDGTPYGAGWYWWVEWYDAALDEYLYEFYPDGNGPGERPGLGGESFTARLEVDGGGQFMFSIDGILIHASHIQASQIPVEPGKIGFWLDRGVGNIIALPPPEDAPCASGVCMNGMTFFDDFAGQGVGCQDFSTTPEGAAPENWIVPFTPTYGLADLPFYGWAPGIANQPDTSGTPGSHWGYARFHQPVPGEQELEITVDASGLAFMQHFAVQIGCNAADGACVMLYVEADDAGWYWGIGTLNESAVRDEWTLAEGTVSAGPQATLALRRTDDGTSVTATLDNVVLATVTPATPHTGPYVQFGCSWRPPSGSADPAYQPHILKACAKSDSLCSSNWTTPPQNGFYDWHDYCANIEDGAAVAPHSNDWPQDDLPGPTYVQPWFGGQWATEMPGNQFVEVCVTGLEYVPPDTPASWEMIGQLRLFCQGDSSTPEKEELWYEWGLHNALGGRLSLNSYFVNADGTYGDDSTDFNESPWAAYVADHDPTVCVRLEVDLDGAVRVFHDVGDTGARTLIAEGTRNSGGHTGPNVGFRFFWYEGNNALAGTGPGSSPRILWVRGGVNGAAGGGGCLAPVPTSREWLAGVGPVFGGLFGGPPSDPRMLEKRPVVWR